MSQRITALTATGLLVLFLAFESSRNATAAPSAPIVVNSLVDFPFPNGNCSLREALMAANNDTPVDACASGSSFDIDVITFAVDGVIELNEGFGPLLIAGSTTIEGNGRARTIIDGDLDTQLFVISNGGRPATLRDMTLTRGQSIGTNLDGGGGAIQNVDGDLTVDNVLFELNLAEGPFNPGGGAIATLGPLTVTGSEFRSNAAASSYNGGGAILAEDTSVSVESTLFMNNSANYAWAGGAIHISQGELEVRGSTFEGNSASDSDFGGGAIYVHGFVGDPAAIIAGSVFTDNLAQVANTVDGGGGAIYAVRDLEVSYSLFDGNGAANGGGIAGYGNSWSIEHSTFTGNVAVDGGGLAHYFSGGTLAVSNSTFSQNTADYGAGLWSVNQVSVVNSTFSLNAAMFGAGLWVGDEADIQFSTIANNSGTGISPIHGYGLYVVGEATLSNTLLAYNAPDDCLWTGALTSSGNNLASDSSCGLSQASDIELTQFEPELIGALEDNGGSTETHALLEGSSAIDRGRCLFGVNSDQRLVGRPQGGQCDIGAFEREVAVYRIYLPIILKFNP